MTQGLIIEESDMTFCFRDSDIVYHIEQSRQYQDRLRGKGLKICEFIMRRDEFLYLVEAKRTCPNSSKREIDGGVTMQVQKYIGDIKAKMADSLALYSAILLKKQSQDDVPAAMLVPDLSGTKIRLLLIVKNAEKKWLVPLQDKLRAELRKECRLWNAELWVLNEEIAKSKHFVE